MDFWSLKPSNLLTSLFSLHSLEFPQTTLPSFSFYSPLLFQQHLNTALLRPGLWLSALLSVFSLQVISPVPMMSDHGHASDFQPTALMAISETQQIYHARSELSISPLELSSSCRLPFLHKWHPHPVIAHSRIEVIFSSSAFPTLSPKLTQSFNNPYKFYL